MILMPNVAAIQPREDYTKQVREGGSLITMLNDIEENGFENFELINISETYSNKNK